jgi:di/tricarboxylate transporter
MDIYITLFVILAAVILFVTEALRVDIVAIGIMVALVVGGVISPETSLKGFANNAVITIAALFVISDALIKTGLLDYILPYFKKLLSKSYALGVTGMGAAVGSISAFINNTPVVATFIPIVSTAAKETDRSPSKYLIPLSYAAILGGTCTLIGTSTNLLVSGIAQDHGLDGFSLFLLTPIGLVFFVIGLIYLVTLGKKLLPTAEVMEHYEEYGQVKEFLTELEVTSELPANKNTIGQLFEDAQGKVKIHLLKRDEEIIEDPDVDVKLNLDDQLLISSPMKLFEDFITSDSISITDTFKDKAFPQRGTKLVEIIILPNSDLTNRKLSQAEFLKQHDANILAIRSRGKDVGGNLEEVRLQAGDILLLQTNEEGYESLRKLESQRHSPFLSMRETNIRTLDKSKLFITGATLIGVIALATSGVLPISISALAGVFVLGAFNVINMHDAYRSIDWKVIVLLAGALSLGAAMDQSGLSNMIGQFLVDFIGTAYGPAVIIAALYLSTALLTEVMSNNASAALMAPIAISVSQTLELNAIPFLVTIAIAGSASFITPIGYQTNTMVYSAGSYKFADFSKVGTPLMIILWTTASLLIPIFYPLS